MYDIVYFPLNFLKIFSFINTVVKYILLVSNRLPLHNTS